MRGCIHPVLSKKQKAGTLPHGLHFSFTLMCQTHDELASFMAAFCDPRKKNELTELDQISLVKTKNVSI